MKKKIILANAEIFSAEITWADVSWNKCWFWSLYALMFDLHLPRGSVFREQYLPTLQNWELFRVWAFKNSSIPKSVIPWDDTLVSPQNTVFPWLCTSWEKTCRERDEFCVVQLVVQQSDSDSVLLPSFLLLLHQGLRMIFWCQKKPNPNTQYAND